MEILNFKGPLSDLIYILKKGGSIHIKKKNRGKFTESAKRAGMGVQEYARHVLANKDKYSSTLVKRANFARNAKKFKHENGGIIRFQPGGTVKLDDYGYPADITPAIVTQNSEFNKFLMTLPNNLRLTPEKDYHMYDYWKLSGKPENFKEGKRRGMFTWDNSDKGYHAGSIAEDRNTGIYHFMKPKHHPTVRYELDWFNKGLQTLEGGKQVPVEGKDKEFWEDFKSKYQLDTTGVDYRYVPIQEKGGPFGRPNFKESKEAYYDPETDTVFAPDSLGEFYHHEMFHARPNLQLLESLKPYYHNLNDDVLKQMGADLSFVKRFNNDPGHFYSPEELGARIVSASEMLNRMGVKDVTLDFLKNARLNENVYGDNFRDLLHMYNDDNLIKIFNAVKKHKSGGILKSQEGTGNLLTPHPLSPVGIALNQAKAMAKMKGDW